MKNFPSALTFLLLLIAVWYTFYSSKPQRISDLETPQQEFSTLRALKHVKAISKSPHFVGSDAHKDSRDYIVNELQNIGLQTEIQEGFSIYKSGDCSRPQNIIAKIKGTESKKALLLLTHYDSSPHSSYGASDAASGVATILESLRAYNSTNKIPKNDIIICISDGEEIGLHGAQLFVKKHPWAKNIGLVINFEARGSGGNSFMLLETNGKNGRMIEEFKKANPKYPIANSLAYSIYKMLPNDTDLTVFREQGDIEGFNFAFIDNHFDYHTANDTWQNLSLNTLQHQGSYLMPLLNYFSENDLSNLKSDKDYIYFNAPFFKIIKYPFDWIFVFLGIVFVLFIALFFYGSVKKRIELIEVLKGFGALFISLFIAGGLSFGGWQFLKMIYPHYQEIQQGFTYNGYQYITVFILLSFGVCFKIYSKFIKGGNLPSMQIASLFIWLILSVITALYLKGASYFIVLVLFGLISLFVLIRQKTPNALLMVMLSFPAIYILFPFIVTFPVALGLKILFVTAVLSVLLFALLIPVVGSYTRKDILGNICILLSFVFLTLAHFNSDFTKEHPKPNSLLYILDADQNKAVWATYDEVLDTWTKNYIKSNENIAEAYNKNILPSKYGTEFQYATKAPVKEIKKSIVEINKDTVIGDTRYVSLSILPQRKVNRMDLYTEKVFMFDKVVINGEIAVDSRISTTKTETAYIRKNKKSIITYHLTDNEPLVLQVQFVKDSVPKFILFESSYDLLKNVLFSVPSRNEDMMPKPFVLNDAVIVKKSFSL